MTWSNEVLKGDNEINLMEVDVDRHSLRLLALDQPMARDLRFIIGSMRIAVDLERIADQAVNIAQRAKFLNSRPPLPHNHAIEEACRNGQAHVEIGDILFYQSELRTCIRCLPNG